MQGPPPTSVLLDQCSWTSTVFVVFFGGVPQLLRINWVRLKLLTVRDAVHSNSCLGKESESRTSTRHSFFPSGLPDSDTLGMNS